MTRQPTGGTNWVVELETKYADLRRQLNEQRERVGSLADSVFRAQIDASQKSAEQGGRLSVVDPAFKPVRPSGPGKTIFLLAGMVLFLALGGTLAIGLAILDDRLYRRDDIDRLGIAVLAVIPALHVPRRNDDDPSVPPAVTASPRSGPTGATRRSAAAASRSR